MLEKGKISNSMAVILMINVILSTGFLVVPRVSIRIAKRDALLSMVVAAILGLVLAWIVAALGQRLQGKTFFEFLEKTLGRFLGKILELVYIVWFIHLTVILVVEYGMFISTVSMPETPLFVFYGAVVIIAAYAVYNGVEIIGRLNQLFFPGLVLLFLTFALTLQNMKVDRILPIFEQNTVTILKSGLGALSWIGEIIVLIMLAPYISDQQRIGRVAFFSTLISGAALLVSVIVVLLNFGPSVSAALAYPVFNTVRLVSIGNFLERLDYIFGAMWITSGIIKVGVFYYCAVLGSAQCLEIRDYRVLVIPVGIIILALSNIIFDGAVDMMYFLEKVFPIYALATVELVIPLILLVISQIKGSMKVKK